MKNPFRKKSPFAHVSPKGPDPIRRERELLAQVITLQEQLAAVASERDELKNTNSRRSLRMNQQLETRDLQTPEARMSQLLVQERKLQAVFRLLSGEAIDGETEMLKQLGNRLGMSMPTMERVFGRMDALQSLAPLRDQLRQGMAGVDWKNDVTFDFPEDRETVERMLALVGR